MQAVTPAGCSHTQYNQGSNLRDGEYADEVADILDGRTGKLVQA